MLSDSDCHWSLGIAKVEPEFIENRSQGQSPAQDPARLQNSGFQPVGCDTFGLNSPFTDVAYDHREVQVLTLWVITVAKL